MWTLLKTLCVAAGALSLIFILWASMKFASLEGEPSSKITSGAPDVTIGKMEPANHSPTTRETASTVLAVSGATFVASLCGFGFAAWRQRSQR